MLNQVVLMGRMATSPEMRQTTTGKMTTSFRVCVDRDRKNANGEREGDFFTLEDPVPVLESCLCGRPLQENAFREALAQTDLSRYVHRLNTEDWIRMIFNGKTPE